MVKLGVIGLGHMGGYHASVSNSLQGARLIAVADPTEASWAKIKDPTIIKTTNYLDWIDQVDGVIIAVPTAHHYSVAKECLSRRKHVLLEKPIASTLEQAQELMDLAIKNNCALHIGHVERFNGAIQELKKIISAPLLIECHRIGPFSPRVQKDSVVLDLMIHDIDLVLGLIGKKPLSVNASGTRVYTESCDIAVVSMTFEGGTVASITSSRASQIKKRSMSIHERDAFFSLDFGTQELSIYRRTNSSVQVSPDQLMYKQEATVEHVFVHKDNPLKLEIEHFVNSIVHGTELSDPEQDIEALAVTFEIERKLGLR